MVIWSRPKSWLTATGFASCPTMERSVSRLQRKLNELSTDVMVRHRKWNGAEMKASLEELDKTGLTSGGGGRGRGGGGGVERVGDNLTGTQLWTKNLQSFVRSAVDSTRALEGFRNPDEIPDVLCGRLQLRDRLTRDYAPGKTLLNITSQSQRYGVPWFMYTPGCVR